MRRRLVLFGGFFLLIFLAVGLAACDGVTSHGSSNAARQAAVNQRNDNYAKAEAAVPAPTSVNFPLRKALAKMATREDALNHPWYVYILGDNGNTIGYYVSQTVPINACDFLSSTEDVQSYTSDQGLSTQVLTAPSLDGIFYGGSGSSSGCDAWIFFDYSTDAMIQIRGVHFYTSDQPLIIDAEPITVQTKGG